MVKNAPPAFTDFGPAEDAEKWWALSKEIANDVLDAPDLPAVQRVRQQHQAAFAELKAARPDLAWAVWDILTQHTKSLGGA